MQGSAALVRGLKMTRRSFLIEIDFPFKSHNLSNCQKMTSESFKGQVEASCKLVVIGVE
jgi:hypothetical protein